MILFMILAAVLAAACVAMVVLPLLRPAASRPAANRAALGSVLVLLIGAPVLYVTWSNWSWHKSPGIDSPEGIVERLIHKLNDHPDDLPGWLHLGRSYVDLQEYPLAVRAYRRADRVADGRSADALIGEANALTLINAKELDGQAGRLIERALILDPSSPKALFFAAAAAMRRGDLSLARTRFARLLALNPPADVKTILEQQISNLDHRLSGKGSSTGAPAGKPDPPRP